MRIGTSKECIKRIVENSPKEFAITLLKEWGKESFNGSVPIGRSYIDSRASGSVMEYVYQWLDHAIAEKYPEIAGKYKRREVYRRLSDALGFQVHIGSADEKICEDIIKTAPLLFKI